MTLERRTLLKTAAAAAAALTSEGMAAERPLRVGVVGAGWFGRVNPSALMQVAPAEIVAYCDPDSEALARARSFIAGRRHYRQAQPPALYADYRTMLAQHAFDIVIVAAPDHWHALPTIAALEAGAHVYVEKPMSRDLREGQAMVAAARRAGKVVQVGTQRRTTPVFLEAKKRIIGEGRLGAVRLVEGYSYYHQRPKDFSAPSTPPAHLDWDLYCGPAPLLPFRKEMHPRDWRAFTAFGNGYMGDMASHMLDLARFLLDLGWPDRISSTAGILQDLDRGPADVPDTQLATFEFGDVLMSWTNRHWGAPPRDDRHWGVTLHGDKGSLDLGSDSWRFTPIGAEAHEQTTSLETALYPEDEKDGVLQVLTRHHMRDFLAAIATGGRPAADVAEGYASASLCILANLSAELKRPLRWDAASERVAGDEEANARLKRAYRAPWRHPSEA